MADAEVVLGAQTGGLTAGIEQATARVAAGFAEMKGAAESLKASMDMVTNSFRLFSDILIGGLIGEKLFEVTKHLAEYGEQVDHAAQKTGISTDALQQLKFAGDMVGVSFDAMQLGLRRLAISMTLAQQGSLLATDAFKAVGITVEDIKGANLQDILGKIADKFQASADGAGKMAAAQQLLGRQGSELIPLLNLGSEGIKKLGETAEQMGLIISEKDLDALHELDVQLKLAHQSATVMERHIASAFVPVLTSMAAAFNQDVAEGGPFKQMIDLLAESIQFLAGTALKLIATFEALGMLIGGLGVAFDELVKGHFAVATQTIRDVITDIDTLGAKTNKTLAAMRGDAQQTASALAALLKAGTGTEEITPVSGKQTDRVSEWKNELEQRYEASGEYFKRDLNAEGEFWEGKLALSARGSKEYIAVQHQIYEVLKAYAKENADANLAILARQQSAEKEDYTKKIALAEQEFVIISKLRGIGSTQAIAARGKVQALERDAATKGRADADQQIQVERDLADKRIQIQRDEIEFRTQMGQIGGDERISQLRAVLDEEYSMRSDALQKEYQLAATTEAEKTKLMDESAKLYGAYLVNVQKLNHDVALNSMHTWENALAPISTAFDQSIQGMIMGTQTMQKALSNMFASIAAQYISMGVKMLVHHIAMEFAKTSATVTGTTARTTAEESATVTSLVMSSMKTIKQIMNSAYETFAGIFGFLSPEMGPYAAGPAAVGMGTVAAAAGSIMSAAGGVWQISSDQMAMVHKNEMVLPADKAAGLRNLTDGGGGGGGGVTFNVHAIDAQGVAQFFRENGAHVAAALKQQMRDSNVYGYQT